MDYCNLFSDKIYSKRKWTKDKEDINISKYLNQMIAINQFDIENTERKKEDNDGLNECINHK